MTVSVIPGNLFQVYSYWTVLSEKQGGDLTRSKPLFTHSALILHNVTAAFDRLKCRKSFHLHFQATTPTNLLYISNFLFECDVTFCVYLLSTNDKKYVLV